MMLTKTFYDYTALFLTLGASCFLIKPNLGLSPETIASISKTCFGYNLSVAKSLTDQNVDTRVGLFILIFSVLIQGYGLFGDIKLEDTIFHLNHFFMSLAFSTVVLFIAYFISRKWKKTLFERARIILECKDA